jgi:RNA:NAD 2'-phosphotransferase (TPT1/KptA family)
MTSKVDVSKAMSKLLRHQALNSGVPMRTDGYVAMDHVLQYVRTHARRGDRGGRGQGGGG